MRNTKGKVHDYLGMLLDFSEKGNVRVTTPKNIQIVPETAPIDMGGLSETPATNNLFQVSWDKSEISM